MGKLTEARLRRWYRLFNRRFFAGKLPPSGCVHLAEVEGCWGVMFHDGKDFAIHISPQNAVCVRIAKMTLLHEMAHLSLWPCNTHGPRFEQEMQRLAAAGAMRALW